MILGICFEKGGFRVAGVSGSLENPQIDFREKLSNPETSKIPKSAHWFHVRFKELIAQHKPEAISAKIHYSLNSQDDLLNHGAPIGLLSLSAHEAGIPLTLLTKKKLQGPLTFGLPKSTKPYDWLDQLRDGKAHWDTATRDALLAAMALLK